MRSAKRSSPFVSRADPRTSKSRSIFAFVLLVGCASPSVVELSVDLRTDYSPGFDFERVEVVVGSQQTELEVVERDDFIEGQRVADLEVDAGLHEVVVRLRDAAGELVASSRLVVSALDDVGTTVTVLRSCRAECPPPDDPNASLCVEDACVDPACDTEDCSSCITDDECGEPMGCGTPRCLDGLCFLTGDDEACPANEYCDGTVCMPAAGCEDCPSGICVRETCSDDACGLEPLACAVGLELDGDDDVVHLPIPEALDEVTVEAFVWIDGDHGGGDFLHADKVTYTLTPTAMGVAGGLRRQMLGELAGSVFGAAEVGRWFHVVVSRRGTTHVMFIDGALLGMLESDEGPTSELSIGPFSGVIANVRVWNGRLGLTTIADLSSGVDPRLSAKLLGWWPFDEGNGQVLHARSGSDTQRGSSTDEESSDPAWFAASP